MKTRSTKATAKTKALEASDDKAQQSKKKSERAESAHLCVEEVCDIIAACKAANVISLRFKDLHVTFANPLDANVTSTGSPTTTSPRNPAELERDRFRKMAEIESAEKMQSDLAAAELELEQSKLNDPEAFEEAMTNDQEFENESSGG